MRRLLVAFALLLTFVGFAAAHPLGNFTVNHATTVDASGRELQVRYILDMAEIPTIRERQQIKALGGLDAYAKTRSNEIGPQLELTVDGTRQDLGPRSSSAVLLKGAGGLQVFGLRSPTLPQVHRVQGSTASPFGTKPMTAVLAGKRLWCAQAATRVSPTAPSRR